MPKVSDRPSAVRVRHERKSAAYWRVTFDHPPLKIFGPEAIAQLGEVIAALSAVDFDRTGNDDLEIVQTWDKGKFEEIDLHQWVRSSPNYLLENNCGSAGVDDRQDEGDLKPYAEGHEKTATAVQKEGMS
jgi:hypothetical protein